MNNKKTAIITFLSISSKKDEIEYIVDNINNDDGTPWIESGINTNDAPVKYLLNKAQKDGNPVSYIVCIVSKEVYNGIDGDRENSTYSNFKKMIGEKYDVEFNSVKYDFDDCDGECVKLTIDQPEKASKICEGIITALKGYDEVYIDYTGGFRDTSFLMTVLIRYLEFINVKCKDIVYSNYQDRKIYTISYIYDIFKLINAVSQFVETGNGKLLYSVYGSEENEEIKELIKVIYEFSQVIQLCNIGILDEKMEVLIKAIQTLETTKKDTKNLKAVMFYELLTVIKKKFYINDTNYTFTYPKLIKWCLDNNLLQQALSFYVEKMPIVYFRENIINKLEGLPRRDMLGSAEEVGMFYISLYDDIRNKNVEVESREDDIVQDFREIIRRIVADSASDTSGCGIVGIILKEKENCENDIIKGALKNISELLEKNYEGCNYEKRKTDGTWYVYDNAVDCKTGIRFLRTVFSNPKLAYSVIYSKKYEKNKYSKADKVDVLERIDKGEYKVEYLLNGKITANDLHGIMMYYLVIKYMRNNINHANEKSEVDNGLLEYLESKKINTAITAKNIHKILSIGLNITHNELFE